VDHSPGSLKGRKLRGKKLIYDGTNKKFILNFGKETTSKVMRWILNTTHNCAGLNVGANFCVNILVQIPKTERLDSAMRL